MNLDGIRVTGIGLLQLAKNPVGVRLDDHQEIVKVMSYASRELTHGFHLLSLAQLILQPLVLGYVVEHALHQRNGSVRSLKQFGFVTEPQDTAIASAHSIFCLIEFAGLDRKSTRLNSSHMSIS